jgi:hypothetical protein
MSFTAVSFVIECSYHTEGVTMKNPHIAELLQRCREARQRAKAGSSYCGLEALQLQLLRVRKANKLRAHIAKTDYSSIEARVMGLLGGAVSMAAKLPSVASFPGEYGWHDPEMGRNFAEVAKSWLIIDAVKPAPRNSPSHPVNWDLASPGVRDYQVNAIDDALSAITPSKYLAAMADCGKTPTGRIEMKFEPVLHQLPSLTQVLRDSEGQPFGVSTGYQVTEEKCPQLFGRVLRIPPSMAMLEGLDPALFTNDNAALPVSATVYKRVDVSRKQSQEDYAKFEITRLTGFKFDHGPAEMDADELLAIFNAGVNLGRML